jgi:hypothetical protein
MLRENATFVVARNERWRGEATTEPVECGWATEAIFFVRSLTKHAHNDVPVWVEISPDGMHWVAIEVTASMPTTTTDVTALRVCHFGNWLRLATKLPDGAEFVALVTLHLK